ncbi:MAG: YgiQ family radical SAM protein, partial [Thermodesulfobacteriota bacterium]
MFLPTTPEEKAALGWTDLDIVLVTGDAYIDHPAMGVALTGRILQSAGFRVGIIAQPDGSSGTDIARLGEPLLFWGVTGGSVDSMVANYTATGRKRKADDFTPGGVNNRRPDRAVIVYANLIRKYFRRTRPIVLGGIEASLRRIAHYDYATDSVRRNILFDAKADYLLYGMADQSVVELAEALRREEDPNNIRGLCYISRTVPVGKDYLALPSFQTVSADKEAFLPMFETFYRNNDPITGQGLFQQQDTRYLVHNPPPLPLSEEELDRVHALPFEREVHPHYGKDGLVRALDTIRFSLTTHRGCYGECNFCAIAVHQGRTVTSRSIASVVQEPVSFAEHPRFTGIISDVGG